MIFLSPSLYKIVFKNMLYYKSFIKSENNKLISKFGEFTYEIGEEYTHTGDIKLHQSGFHFCRTPKDCYKYYDQKDGNIVICEVEPLGVLLWGG